MSEPWPQISAIVEADAIEAIEASLFETGALSVTAEDAADAPILEPAPGTTPLWSLTRLRALFAQGTALTPLLARLTAQHPGIEWHADLTLADRDWTRAWLDHFRPMQFGRLRVRPVVWEEGAAPPEAQVDLRLDPGLAFGTGTHPSTASCLRWLAHEVALANARVLDYGCGSGILAIAACLLGARRATCVDIDPQALTAAAANATVNGVRDRLALTADDHLAATGYDVVVANILAGPLVALAPRLALLAAPGARLKLAGILTAQARDVARAYAPWFEVAWAPVDEQWARVTGTRRAAARGTGSGDTRGTRGGDGDG